MTSLFIYFRLRHNYFMKIEALQTHDIQGCLDIYNYYIINTCNTLEEEPLSLGAFQSRMKQITKDYPFIVAKDENSGVIGYAYLSVFNPRSAYRRTADLSIYVHKDHVHQHVGIALFQHIEALAKAQGFTNLISIITSLNDASCRFHQAMGFIQEGHLKTVAYKMNGLIDVFYYRKSLLP